METIHPVVTGCFGAINQVSTEVAQRQILVFLVDVLKTDRIASRKDYTLLDVYPSSPGGDSLFTKSLLLFPHIIILVIPLPEHHADIEGQKETLLGVVSHYRDGNGREVEHSAHFK